MSIIAIITFLITTTHYRILLRWHINTFNTCDMKANEIVAHGTELNKLGLVAECKKSDIPKFCR